MNFNLKTPFRCRVSSFYSCCFIKLRVQNDQFANHFRYSGHISLHIRVFNVTVFVRSLFDQTQRKWPIEVGSSLRLFIVQPVSIFHTFCYYMSVQFNICVTCANLNLSMRRPVTCCGISGF